MQENGLPPVKVDEVFEIEIKSVGKKGDGMAKVNGYVLFVKNATLGEWVKVKVTKVTAKYGFAEVVD